MRRVSTVVVALVLLAPAAWSAAQSADDIVNQHLKAKGGVEKLKSVNSLRQTCELVRDGKPMTLVISAKRPNLARQDLTFGGKTLVNLFDGQSAWMINPFSGSSEPMQLAGPDAESTKEQATFDSPLVDYKTRGTTVELVGTEPAGSNKVHHLKVTSASGRAQHVYIDAATGLESKVVTETPNGTVEQHFSDFRDVDGVKMAFAIRTVVAGKTIGDIKVVKAELNPPLDDALFKVK